LSVVAVAMVSLGGAHAIAGARVGGLAAKHGPAWFRMPGGGAGASVSIPPARRAVADVLLVVNLGRAGELEGLLQVGGPLDDQAGSLIGEARVFGFVLPPSSSRRAVIM
jgi:hypothetical protein